ncbi:MULTISPECIES: amino acid permease [Brevibacillus]|uniref:Amino acid permease n=1 Tax=Brevibacillus invocatus TaxID=173959 RepID=A0A3M8C4U4_9BACL|nr:MULTISPECIES: amino acid permease [Brevibacillus]MCM3080627.1 amino acid permease [Brevibacillus invocatus]MCM3430756.1 amino acid permease [Brevibacillus invocatus]MDH4618968.1 amino acid permease [Brevibacillus sp. AY1]RNB69935.1 amino acid permease [Brevibacillus invocatus]
MAGDANQFQKIMDREGGLQRGLTTGQLTMIAIGGAIGTGLFLGSGFAIGFAGPSVLISYAIGAVIAFLLMGCLAEMTVAHPTSGSFGAFAEHYINPWAGFAVRYSYWACIVAAVGVEISAVAVYMKYWFPTAPGWIWIVLFSAVLIYVNATSVKMFGSVEYWFSMIKIVAIVSFILLGAYVVFGTSGSPEIGFHNYTDQGGFLPNGWWGMWVAVIVALFSYLSIEMIAVTAGEAQDPEKAVPKALRSTVVRLIVFYLLTLTLMLAIVPWKGAGVDKSPFVKVMELFSIPGAGGIMNFVVLIAALSAMNSQLYITTRMMFSLSRAGYAPKRFGTLSKKGVPTSALSLSTIGIALAAILEAVAPDESFILMMGISLFGAMFTWFMIFVTHLFFRRKWEASGGRRLPVRMIGFPYLTLLGAGLMLAIMFTTWFTDAFQMTLLVGVPWMILITLAYWLWKRAASNRTEMTEGSQRDQVL